MVAAWMSADAGVGPAMASGSHVCSGNWADLPMTPKNNETAATTRTVLLIVPFNAFSLIAAISKVLPAAKNKMMMPMRRPISPVRVVKNAFSAALVLFGSSHQCPMSRNEQRPMSSQPNSRPRVVELCTIHSIAAVNKFNAAK